MHLETTWDVQIDEHGVIDGRELARQMIASAYLALVPYVDACPACTDSLFSVIANKAIEDVQKEGMTGAGLYVGPTPAGLVASLAVGRRRGENHLGFSFR